jgi:hypothetical protein
MRAQFHRDSKSKGTLRPRVEFDLLQFIVHPFTRVSHCDGSHVFYLFFSKELVVRGNVSAVGAVAGKILAIKARARFDFEYFFAFGTFSPS